MAAPNGRKLYKDATSGVSDPMFDLASNGLKLFLSSVRRRAHKYGRTSPTGISLIPEDSSNPGAYRFNLLSEYGEVSRGMIKDYDATYMGRPCRAAQDNAMLFECLMASLDATARRKLSLKEHEFTVGTDYSGSLLLKTIIKAGRLDTTASENMIRERLSTLNEYMLTVEGNDISTFNEYVRGQVDALASRGAVSTDLLINLFKGYLAASDHRFTKYMEDKQSNFEDGHLYTEDDLMDLAEARFDLLTDKGLWNKPSAEQEQLLVMKAQIDNLKRPTKKRTREQPDEEKRATENSSTQGRKQELGTASGMEGKW